MRDESSRFDDGLSLQHLRDLSLEDGRAYIQEHTHKLTNHVAIGIFLAEEAGNQLFRNSSISLKLTELLIFFGEAVRHDPSHALGLAAKGRALMSVGHAQAALAFLDTAGEKFLRLGDERNWAKTRKDWMITCAWLGRPEEALQEAAHAREVFKRLGEDYLVCNIDHNTAMIYTELGRCEEACRLYKSILATYPTLADQNETSMKLAVALAQMNLAIVLAWLGNFEQAYDLQQHAQASFVSLEETSMVINSEINLAEFDYAQGYYGSALRRYYHACDSLTEHNINRPLSLASLKLWMAKCLVKLNRQHEASQLADEAVKEYRQHGASLLTSNALLEYATALLACRRFKDALAALDEAWTFIDCSRFERYALATKLLQAELLLEMGSFTEAYERAAAIREYFETQGLVSYSIRASLVMASTLLERAQEAGADGEEEQRSAMLHEAVWLCEQANRRAHRHNLQEQVYKSQSLLGRLDAIQGNFGKAAKHYQIAINHIEHILSDLVHDQYSSFLNTCWAVYEDMIALCLQQTQAERAFGYLERIRSLALRQYFSKAKT